MNEQSTTQITQQLARESKELLGQSMVKIDNCLDQLAEEQVWWRPDEKLNSVGNLLLHIEGNLRQWVIAGVKGQADQRDAIPKQELRIRLKSTVDEVGDVIDNVAPMDWLKNREIQGFQVNTIGAVLHTCTHFVGHTHQIIMLTRMQLGDRYRFSWTPDEERGSVPL